MYAVSLTTQIRFGDVRGVRSHCRILPAPFSPIICRVPPIALEFEVEVGENSVVVMDGILFSQTRTVFEEDGVHSTPLRTRLGAGPSTAVVGRK